MGCLVPSGRKRAPDAMLAPTTFFWAATDERSDESNTLNTDVPTDDRQAQEEERCYERWPLVPCSARTGRLSDS